MAAEDQAGVGTQTSTANTAGQTTAPPTTALTLTDLILAESQEQSNTIPNSEVKKKTMECYRKPGSDTENTTVDGISKETAVHPTVQSTQTSLANTAEQKTVPPTTASTLTDSILAKLNEVKKKKHHNNSGNKTEHTTVDGFNKVAAVHSTVQAGETATGGGSMIIPIKQKVKKKKLSKRRRRKFVKKLEALNLLKQSCTLQPYADQRGTASPIATELSTDTRPKSGRLSENSSLMIPNSITEIYKLVQQRKLTQSIPSDATETAGVPSHEGRAANLVTIDLTRETSSKPPKGEGCGQQLATGQKSTLKKCERPLNRITSVALHTDYTQQISCKRMRSPEQISSKRRCLREQCFADDVTFHPPEGNAGDISKYASNANKLHLRVVIVNQIRNMTPAETTVLRKVLEIKLDLWTGSNYSGPPVVFTNSPRPLAGGLRIHCLDDWSLQWLNGAVESLGQLWDDCGGFYTIPMDHFTQYLKGVVFVPDFPGDVTALRNALAVYNKRFYDITHWPLFTHKKLQNGAVTNHVLVFGVPPAEVEKLRSRGCRVLYKLTTVNVSLKGRLGDRNREKGNSEGVESDGSSCEVIS